MKSHKLRLRLCAVALGAMGLVLLTPGVGSADLLITTNTTSPLDNINFTDATNTTILGQTTGSGPHINVSFYTAPQIMLDSNSGQASIQAHVPNALTNLTAEFLNGYGATTVDFSVQQLAAAGTLVITAYDQNDHSFTATLAADKSKENKYDIKVSSGANELITKISWVVTGTNMADNQTVAKQYRTGGVMAITDLGPGTVPEPSTAMLGFVALGALGLFEVRRRAHAKRA